MTNGLSVVPLSEFLTQRKEFFTIDDFVKYKRARVKSHGQGIVLRDEVNGTEIKTKKQQAARTGEFLVAEIDAKVGGFGIVPPELDGAVVSSHYFLFQIDKNKCSKEWLDWFVRYNSLEEQTKAQGSTNYAAIRPSDVLNFEIPLPPLTEQRRIVAHIESLAARVNEVVKLKNESVELSDNLYKITRDKLYREMQFPRQKISEVFDLINGRAFKPEDWKAQGMKIVRIQNLKYPEATYNYFDEPVDEKFIIRKGDVLFAWSGQIVSLGAHIWDGEEAILNQHIFNVKAKVPMLPKFIQDGLNALINEMKGQVRGLEMFHIRKQELGQLLFPVPPLDEQQRIVAYLDGLQAKVNALRWVQVRSGEELSALLPSVLDRAFKGEL